MEKRNSLVCRLRCVVLFSDGGCKQVSSWRWSPGADVSDVGIELTHLIRSDFYDRAAASLPETLIFELRGSLGDRQPKFAVLA
jgi:hypothetical protein